jgi:hypothetical protein
MYKTLSCLIIIILTQGMNRNNRKNDKRYNKTY